MQQVAFFSLNNKKLVTIPVYSKQLVYTICPLPIVGWGGEYFIGFLLVL